MLVVRQILGYVFRISADQPFIRLFPMYAVTANPGA